MIASVHLVDGRPREVVKRLRNGLDPATPGLRNARTFVAAPLDDKVISPLQIRRTGIVAFWDDDEALDRFEANDRFPERFGEGWRIRLEPVRAIGSWPGLPTDLPTSPAVVDDGPTAVGTLGRLRKLRALPFLRASTRAEADLATAPGLAWATGLLHPPGYVGTLSLWQSGSEMSDYVRTRDGHSAAMRANAQKPFHHQQAFIRFRPYKATGSLPGTNPLTSDVTAQMAGQPT